MMKRSKEKNEVYKFALEDDTKIKHTYVVNIEVYNENQNKVSYQSCGTRPLTAIPGKENILFYGWLTKSLGKKVGRLYHKPH